MDYNHGLANSPAKRSSFFALRRRSFLAFTVTALVVLYLLATRVFDFDFEIPGLSFSDSGRSRTVRGGPWTQADELRSLIFFTSTYPDKSLQHVDIDAGLMPATFGAVTKAREREWTRHTRAMDEQSPVVVFSKTYCPYSKKAKSLLASYDLEPKPLIIEVDLRDDSDVVKALLYKYTGRSTFPNIIVQSKTIGGSDDLDSLHNSGELGAIFARAGVASHREEGQTV